jgi:hypothetical protein
MGRTEALQGVRMAMFLNLLNRWESASRAPSGMSLTMGGETVGKDAGDRSRVRAKSRIACGSLIIL